jgi:hypothetical protein
VHGSAAAGRKTYKAPRKRGHSKNGRGDAPQIVIGMAVTREGFPVRHWVFPGNTVDVTTVARVKQDLRGWQLTRCLFVGDAGVVSAANFHALAAGGGKYLMCMPLRRGDAITEQVLSRAGRYAAVAQNLQVKEVVLGDGERRARYVVCFNAQEAQRQKAQREQIVHEIEAELVSLRHVPEEGPTASAHARCAPAPAMGDTCWTLTRAWCSIDRRSRPPSASTASSWSTATTTRSALRTWRWATSNCNVSSKPGAT